MTKFLNFFYKNRVGRFFNPITFFFFRMAEELDFYENLLAVSFAYEMKNSFHRLKLWKCPGCFNSALSQTEHDFCFRDKREQIVELFDDMLDNVCDKDVWDNFNLMCFYAKKQNDVPEYFKNPSWRIGAIHINRGIKETVVLYIADLV